MAEGQGGHEHVVPALEVRASLTAIESGNIALAQLEAPVAVAIETGETISQAQARRLFALSREVHGENGEAILKSLLAGRSSKEVLVSEYEGLIADLETK